MLSLASELFLELSHRLYLSQAINSHSFHSDLFFEQMLNKSSKKVKFELINWYRTVIRTAR